MGKAPGIEGVMSDSLVDLLKLTTDGPNGIPSNMLGVCFVQNLGTFHRESAGRAGADYEPIVKPKVWVQSKAVGHRCHNFWC